VRRVLCATPGYFKRHGLPTTPKQLVQHNCLHYTHFGSQGGWRFRDTTGEIVVPVKGSLRVDDDDVLSQAVLSGLGIGLLPTFIIGRELQAGLLVSVLSDLIPMPVRIYAMHLPNAHLPMKVRGFIDFLQARFGPVPYWDRREDAAPVPVLPPS
jgi:DNA-binding transcriptional LysR family regulator